MYTGIRRGVCAMDTISLNQLSGSITLTESPCTLVVIPQMRSYLMVRFAVEGVLPTGPWYWIVDTPGRKKQLAHNLNTYQKALDPTGERRAVLPTHLIVGDAIESLLLLERALAHEMRLFLLDTHDLQNTVPAPATLMAEQFPINRGESIDLSQLQQVLDGWEYTREYEVTMRGTYAVRGGIIDVFPFERAQPLRIEFFGATVDSLRSFDPLTQLSMDERLEEYTLTGSEKKAGALSVAPFSAYLKSGGRLVLDSPDILSPAQMAEVRGKGVEVGIVFER